MLQELILPKFCLHCHGRSSSYLCRSCQEDIQFVDDREVCLLCAEKKDSKSLLCIKCHIRKKDKAMLPARIFSCCNNCPPLRTLLYYYEHQKWSSLAKLFGALLAARFIDDIDASIDLITFTPQYFFALWKKGFHPEKQIAKELSKYLHVPVWALLSLVKPEPQTLDDIYIKKPLWNKTILLLSLRKKDQEKLILYSKKLLENGAWKVLILTLT